MTSCDRCPHREIAGPGMRLGFAVAMFVPAGMFASIVNLTVLALLSGVAELVTVLAVYAVALGVCLRWAFTEDCACAADSGPAAA